MAKTKLEANGEASETGDEIITTKDSRTLRRPADQVPRKPSTRNVPSGSLWQRPGQPKRASKPSPSLIVPSE